MHSCLQICNSYEAIELIGRFLTNDDLGMLSLDVGVSVTRFGEDHDFQGGVRHPHFLCFLCGYYFLPSINLP